MGFISGLMGAGAAAGAGSAAGGSLASIMGMAGTALGGLSAYQQSRQSAAFASANARNAMQEAENKAWQSRDAAKRQAAAQRASFGASGIDVNVGSPLNALADIDAEGELGAMDAIYQGKMNKMGWDIKKNQAKQGGRNALFGSLSSLGNNSGLRTFSNNFYKAGGLKGGL